VTKKPAELNADTLRWMLKAGGLEIAPERAQMLLPIVSSLLAGCDRLAAIDVPIGAGAIPQDRRASRK
jgi:hypothetical protein